MQKIAPSVKKYEDISEATLHSLSQFQAIAGISPKNKGRPVRF